MANVWANDIVIEYEASGPEDGTPMLLIRGVGAQFVRWPPALVDRLVAAVSEQSASTIAMSGCPPICTLRE